jgi:hypothetical protein
VNFNGTINDYNNETQTINVDISGNHTIVINDYGNNTYNFNMTDNSTVVNNNYYPSNTSNCSTTTITPPILITSTLIPECHNRWDIVLITLVTLFGLLALAAMAALAFLLFRRPICGHCGRRHAPGSKECTTQHQGGYVPRGRTDDSIDLPEN